MKKPSLTVFTPTFNRAHTLPRTYESLCRQTCKDFEWFVVDDGSTDGTKALVESWQLEQTSKENGLKIRYIYKENGGLYTGYNIAYANIDTELCVCIDSDDYMPDDAVEKILKCWQENGSERYCGIVGLDYNVVDKKPIGGFFPSGRNKVFFAELKHVGDTKLVFRTELMKVVAPMVGFPGEKDFNPHYMQMQVLDKYPILLLNENLCWVEYQIGADSMSAGIFKQYIRSPRSYAKYRLMEMQMKRGMTLKRKLMLYIHYVSSCILSHDKSFLKNAPSKLLTFFVMPLGLLETLYVKWMCKKWEKNNEHSC